MKQRIFGRSSDEVSEIGLGTWQEPEDRSVEPEEEREKVRTARDCY